SDRSLGPPSHGNPVEPIKKRTDSFDRFSASCAVSSTVLDGADRWSVAGGCLLGRVNRLGELARPADIARRRRPTPFALAEVRTPLAVGGRGESSEFLVARQYRVASSGMAFFHVEQEFLYLLAIGFAGVGTF